MSRPFSPDDFPFLFRDVTWGPLRCRFELRDRLPPAELIGNVNCVPFAGDQWLVIRLQDGSWEVPGGTLEPGESYIDTIRRELLEEAGASLLAFELFGAWHCFSSAAEPYRPHLPHPDSYRVVGCGQVELATAPENPADGEQVVRVETVSLEEAERRFLSVGRPELAELYRLAAVVRQERPLSR